jgi:hypothetical protein
MTIVKFFSSLVSRTVNTELATLNAFQLADIGVNYRSNNTLPAIDAMTMTGFPRS